MLGDSEVVFVEIARGDHWIDHLVEGCVVLRAEGIAVDGEFSSVIEIIVVGWIDQTATSMTLARGEALRLVKRAIEASGVALPNTTYTLQIDGAVGATDAAQQSSQSTPPKLQDSAKVAAVGAQAEGALDRMIDAEREIGEGEDLLRDDAAKE